MPLITTVTGLVGGLRAANIPSIGSGSVAANSDSYSTSAVVVALVRGHVESRALVTRKAGDGVQPIFGGPNRAPGKYAGVYSIMAIVPGPIANSNLGYQIGLSAFLRNVPRVYPPIFIQPRDN